jgi:hypothetical protein
MNVKAFFTVATAAVASLTNINSQTLFVPGANGSTPGIGVSTNGNVGVGTNSPRAYFDIYNLNLNELKSVLARLPEGNNSGEGTYLGVKSYNSQSENNEPCCDIKSFSIEHKFYGLTNNSINFYRGGDRLGGFLTFSTGNNTERVRIDASGKVGIRTTSPQTLLDLGELRLDAITNFPAEGAILEETWGNYIIGDVNKNQRLRFGVSNDGYTRAEINIDNSNRIDGVIQFKTINTSGGALSRMQINGDGNVLIGKTTQTNTAYKLDVAGKIRADEIVVNTTGADFVFDSTYNLRTLPELETFIKQNKHLPEIAPAKEMQENGVSASEMQAKLLQKVEELTLYVIELKKENEKLQEGKSIQMQMLLDMKKDIENLKQDK